MGRRSAQLFSIACLLLATQCKIETCRGLSSRPALLPCRAPAGAHALELTETSSRSIPWRLTDPRADHFRPFEPAQQVELSITTRAELERKNDLRGAITASLLARQSTTARNYLDRLEPGDDCENDRAVAELMEGKAEVALSRLNRVLRNRPAHPQALWNRALTFEALSLPLTSTRAFAESAELGEQGWSDEARARAFANGDGIIERGRRWKELDVFEKKVIELDEPWPDELVREFPGAARRSFYEALRLADRRDRAHLEHFARELDRYYGGTELAEYVERELAADNAARRKLKARYRALLLDQLGPADKAALLDELRSRGEGQLLIGARLATYSVTEAIEEYAAASLATGDAWQYFLSEQEAARDLVERGDYAAAEPRLQRAVAECAKTKLWYRCSRLEYELARIYNQMQRTTEARPHALRSLSQASANRDWSSERRALYLLGWNEYFRDNLDLARAYFSEMGARALGDCSTRSSYHSHLAMFHLIELHPLEAREELSKTEDCGDGDSIMTLMARVDVHRATRNEEDARAVEKSLQYMRANPPASEGMLALLDMIEGRFLLQRKERERGTRQLREAIRRADSAPRGDADAGKAKMLAYSALIIDAMSANDRDAAFALSAEEVQLPENTSCAIGVTVDDERTVVLVRGVDGKTEGFLDTERKVRTIDFRKLIAPNLLAVLSNCPVIDVLARPPLVGRADILPTALAWRFRTGAGTAEHTAAVKLQRLVVANVEPPPHLRLSALRPYDTSKRSSDTEVLDGPQATPSRALEKMSSATEIEFHVHGLVDLAISDASFLVLSPDASGRYMLTAAEVRARPLTGRPLVILGACRATASAPYLHQSWSLPTAFLEAGARAVIASSEPISDAEAGPFFDQVRRSIREGKTPAVAVLEARNAAKLLGGSDWVEKVMVFE